jgi:hypothetical protein
MIVAVSFLSFGTFGMSIVSIPITLPVEIIEGTIYDAAHYISHTLWNMGYTEIKGVTIKELEPA